MSKIKTVKVASQSSHTTIGSSYNANTNYNSTVIKKDLDNVKKEVRTVQEAANVDPRKLSLNFTV